MYTNNKLFNEDFSEKAYHRKSIQVLTNLLKSEFVLGAFWNQFVSPKHIQKFQYCFDNGFSVGDDREYNFSQSTPKQFDILIKDSTRKNGIAVFFPHFRIEEFEADMKILNLDEVANIYFVYDFEYAEALNRSFNKLYYKYSDLIQWLGDIKSIRTSSTEQIDDATRELNDGNSDDIRVKLRGTPEGEKLEAYLMKLRYSGGLFKYSIENDTYQIGTIKTAEFGYWLMEVCYRLGLMRKYTGTSDQYRSEYFTPIFKNKKGKRYTKGTLRKYIERAQDLQNKRKEIEALLVI